MRILKENVEKNVVALVDDIKDCFIFFLWSQIMMVRPLYTLYLNKLVSL